MPSSVCKQEHFWVFAHQNVACLRRETASPLPSVSVVCQHLSHQSNPRAQTSFPAHSPTSCRASYGPGKEMSVVERQPRQQPDEHEGCHTVSIEPLKEQGFFYMGVSLLNLGELVQSCWVRLAGDPAGRWQCAPCPTVALLPTNSSTSRI